LETEVKGAEVTQFVSRLKDAAAVLRNALSSDPEIRVTHLPPYLAFSQFPATADELHANYDVVLLSDIGSETLTTWPLEEGHPLVPRPNRMRELTRFVEQGGGLIFAGGYITFQGRYGRGNWYGTPIAEALPVEILNVVDDRQDTPEGVRPKIIHADHPVTRGIPWEDCPPFFGYNKSKIKANGDLLGAIEDYPFLAVGMYGKARVLAFTSDPCPHWGEYFSQWRYYPQFWQQVVRWVGGKS
jgi:uncharacterized membrane protein